MEGCRGSAAVNPGGLPFCIATEAETSREPCVGVDQPLPSLAAFQFQSVIKAPASSSTSIAACAVAVCCNPPTLQEQLEGAEQQQGGKHHNSNNSSSTPGAWPSYDAAVQHLAVASARRQLPGQFYGRLCNVVSVADASLQPAVNAALQERCNLASTLIVSDRATAAAVIEHFRQNKVGTVNCKILSELQQQRTSNELTATAAAAAAGCTPLLQLLQYNRQAVQGLQPLLEQLLGGWLLVESREVALGLLHLRRSMVTRWVVGVVRHGLLSVACSVCTGSHVPGCMYTLLCVLLCTDLHAALHQLSECAL